MFTCFRSSVWCRLVGLGPARPYRQSSVSPVYPKVKVGDVVLCIGRSCNTELAELQLSKKTLS